MESEMGAFSLEDTAFEPQPPEDILVCGECGADFTDAELLKLVDGANYLSLCPQCGWEYTVLHENPPRGTKNKKTIQQRFADFNNKHPEVYWHLVASARRLQRKGFERGAIRMIWEHARWYFLIEQDMGEEFKFNDHYHSRYSRLIASREPELKDFFEQRRLRTK